MGRVTLLPRLDVLGVDQLMEGFPETGLPRSVLDVPDVALPELVTFGASGGSKSSEAAREIGVQLISLAKECGFPEQTSQSRRASLDQKLAIYLSTHPLLQSGEALRDDVWAYLATAVVPDLVAWRFPNRPPTRYRGGVRNALQRLWMRGYVLDRGEHHPRRWELVENLGEDAVVAIIERPSVGNKRVVARALAEGWLRMSNQDSQGDWEELMRTAIKLFRLRNEIVDLASLDQEQLDQTVDNAFETARRTMTFREETRQAVPAFSEA